MTLCSSSGKIGVKSKYLIPPTGGSLRRICNGITFVPWERAEASKVPTVKHEVDKDIASSHASLTARNLPLSSLLL